MSKVKDSSFLSYERKRTIHIIKNLIDEVISKGGVNEDVLLDTLLDKINNSDLLNDFDLTTLLYLEAELNSN